MADVLSHHADVGIPGHLFIDGVTQGVEQKGFSHGSASLHRRLVPGGPGGANLSQPPAAKVLRMSTESSMPGNSSTASRPRSWGVIAGQGQIQGPD